MDEVDQETLNGHLTARGHWRRKFLQASSFMGAFAAVEPWFARLARAQESGVAPKRQSHHGGRVHVVPSTKERVQLGVRASPMAAQDSRPFQGAPGERMVVR